MVDVSLDVEVVMKTILINQVMSFLKVKINFVSKLRGMKIYWIQPTEI